MKNINKIILASLVILLFACPVSAAKKNGMYKPKGQELKVRNVYNVTLKWNKVKKSDYYQVFLLDNNSEVVKKDNQVNKTTKKLKSLNSNKAYKWKVRACNERGCSAWSKTKNLRTNPAKLASISTKKIRTRSAKISWTNIARSKLLERYYFKLLNEDGEIIETRLETDNLEDDKTTFYLHRLDPGSEYTVKSRAVYSKDKEIRSIYQSASFTADASDYDASDIEIIDVHAHTVIRREDADAASLISEMENWNVSKMINVPFPCATATRSNSASEGGDLLEYFTDYSDKVYTMYGGFKLNPILYGLGGEASFDSIEDIYPNGTDVEFDEDEVLAEMEGMIGDEEIWVNRFKGRARSAAESGNYVGFGELGPLHYSLQDGHPYVTYPANHSLLKWLSNLAEEYNMVLDIHIEAETEKMAQFEELLEYNEGTNIIWDHVGWANTEQEDMVGLFTQMMEDHPNLYLSMKIRGGSDEIREENSPLDSDGNLESDWSVFFQDYADRIMLGTDNKYWQTPGETEEENMEDGLETIQELLDQLPQATAEQIYYQTAKDLFGF